MLIVSVHDVAPSTSVEVRWLLDRLDEVGVTRRVLKVIPHELDAWDVRRAPELAELLRDEVARGSEVVLHGWSHREDGPLWGPRVDVLRGRLFAGGRAEFLSIGSAEAASRIRDGVQALTELGLSPRGFCAPAWLGRSDLPDMARDAGLDYLVWLSGIEDLRRDERTVIPPIGYLGVGGLREALAQIGGVAAMTIARRRNLPLRIVLHPQGARVSPHAQRAIALAGALRRHRSVVTYGEVIDRRG